MSGTQSREELCPACLAFPGEHDRRVIVGFPDGRTVQTWHKDDCPLADQPPQTDE
ncbi:hypothetical protein [Streptomyces tendae]|uniref:hypothetical protein n=1 Tax=Streptomyces tendae TaxID=1932 RepID=UPI00382594A5